MKRRDWLDHAPGVTAGSLLLLYGLTGLAGMLWPEPEGAIHDGLTGVGFFFIIGSLYGAAAILLPEVGRAKWWHPSITELLVVMWVGGWTVMGIWGIIRVWTTDGPEAARGFLGGVAFVWGLFVGLPSLITVVIRLLRAGRGDEYEGFVRD